MTDGEGNRKGASSKSKSSGKECHHTDLHGECVGLHATGLTQHLVPCSVPQREAYTAGDGDAAWAVPLLGRPLSSGLDAITTSSPGVPERWAEFLNTSLVPS